VISFSGSGKVSRAEQMLMRGNDDQPN